MMTVTAKRDRFVQEILQFLPAVFVNIPTFGNLMVGMEVIVRTKHVTRRAGINFSAIQIRAATAVTGFERFFRIRAFVRTERRKRAENTCIAAVTRDMRFFDALLDLRKFIFQRRIFAPMNANMTSTQCFPKIIRHFRQQQTVGDDENPRMRISFARDADEIVYLRMQQRFAAHQADGTNGKFFRKRPYVLRILLQIRKRRFGHQRTKVRTTFTV